MAATMFITLCSQMLYILKSKKYTCAFFIVTFKKLENMIIKRFKNVSAALEFITASIF